MSVSTTAAAAATASVAQNPSCNRLPSKLYAVPICRSRLKPFSTTDLPASGAQGCWLLHVMPVHKENLRHVTAQPWRLRALVSGDAADGGPRGKMAGQFSFDKALAVLETLCIVPSVMFAVGSVLGLAHPGMSMLLQTSLGNVFFVWQFVLLVGAVTVGAIIRRRQWRRFCRENCVGLSLIDRIEKVEEDIRSSSTVIRVLSRQLEKFGIRFRVARKALKESITETATLAQKNSEATRALALHEDILEKEIGEIQKVLLAMQEQQQKQLELILAIGKAGKLIIEGKKETVVERAAR